MSFGQLSQLRFFVITLVGIIHKLLLHFLLRFFTKSFVGDLLVESPLNFWLLSTVLIEVDRDMVVAREARWSRLLCDHCHRIKI